MKWNSEWESGHTKWKGRKNGIKFFIVEGYKPFSRNELEGYYVSATIVKEDIALNSLWVRPIFESLEEAQEWCEGLTKEELIRLRDIGLNKK